MTPTPEARLCAGIPALNTTLFWRTRFLVGDPVAYLEIERADSTETVLILRDIEMARAREKTDVDRVACPADFAGEGGLSGDRETATAQAAAECLRRAGVKRVVADRSLPLIYAAVARELGLEVLCDPGLWVEERRQKSEEEIEHLAEAQRVTEGAMEFACRLIARAEARPDGVLLHEGEPLTSERVRAAIDHWLLDRGYTAPASIVAGGPAGADCHDLGSGELRSGQPVIVDIFPQNRLTRYNGDCTRTVVHGDIPDEIRRMHEVVVRAKEAGIAATHAGTTGEHVHRATIQVIEQEGFELGLPEEGDSPSRCAMTHGTGHGVGLEVHEPPLLDFGGPPLLPGEALTIEPGLYRPDLGGVRVEDLVIVTGDSCRNLNQLPEQLDWR